MILALVLLVIISVNCVRNEEWENPVPDNVNEFVDTLLTVGWRNYYERNYDVAFAKFDTVTGIQGKNPDGYIGRGFASIELGSDDPTSYDAALMDFKFVIYTLEGKTPFEFYPQDTFLYVKFYPDSGKYLIVPKYSRRILGLDTTATITIIAKDTLGALKTTTSPLFALKGDSIIIPSVTKNFIYPDSNTLFIPDAGTIFLCNVIGLKDSIGNQSAAAALGFAQLYQVKFKKERKEEPYWKSVIYANLVKRLYPENIPSLGHYYDKRITAKAARIILAQDYFFKGYYYSSMWEVIEMKPEAAGELDPNAVDFILKLQQQISTLKP